MDTLAQVENLFAQVGVPLSMDNMAPLAYQLELYGTKKEMRRKFMDFTPAEFAADCAEKAVTGRQLVQAMTDAGLKKEAKKIRACLEKTPRVNQE